MIAIYPFLQNNFVDKSLTHRQQELETIEKLRKGESYEAFKEKFIMDNEIAPDDEELKKLYISYNFMDSVIKKIVAYCPDLKIPKTRSSKKRKLIKDALNDIDWKGLQNENYDTLESCGDTFFEIYFDDEFDKIPKLRVLESKNMQRALLDDYNRYHSYIYREWVEDLVPTYTDGGVREVSRRERIIVFQKGRKVVCDPIYDENGFIKKDKDGNYIYDKNIILNRDSYANAFPLIHIKGYKKQSQEFSEIPASFYIDPALTLDQITSDLRQINRMLGYPMIMIIDGKLVFGSKRTPAGVMGVKSTGDLDKQAQVRDVQISNKLDSIFNEFYIVRDDLFDKVGLINPTMQQKLNTDSSRVIQQFNLPSENKIELYIDNTIKAMQLWFEILLKENDLYNPNTDKNLSFQKPKFIIKSSPFDELLYEQSEIKSTKKSRQEIYIENGDLDEEIELRKKEINEELGDETEDKSFAPDEVVDRVSNGQNVDKNMINT